MKVEGECHCGAIAYEAVVDEDAVSVCHCTDCQVLTGTAYRVSAPARRADFRLLRGEPTIYVKKADSGANRVQAFCGRCGSPLYATDADDGTALLGLRVGALRQRDALRPVRQIWCSSALDWTGDLSGLERREKE